MSLENCWKPSPVTNQIVLNDQEGLYLAGPFVENIYDGCFSKRAFLRTALETTLVNVPTYSAEIKQAIKTNTVEAN